MIRDLVIAWLHLAVLWAFAVARPLFEVLENGPEFFVARGNTSADIVAFALALTSVPPTLMLLCEVLLFRLPAARRALHLAFVGLLLAAIVLQVIGGWGAGSAVLIAASLALGAAGAFAYARTRVARAVLSVLSPAPVVFLVLFLLISPVSKLVLPQEEVTASTSARSSTPVVLLVFDEFAGSSLSDSRGRIDASRFPHFAALARDSTWYPNATTVADKTTRAVPAILTGDRPENDLLPIASDYPQNLFTVLGESHSLNVVEPATSLCPEQECKTEVTASTGSRLRGLFDDLSVVSAHLLLPEDLEDDLPAVDRAFAGFRTGGRDAPANGAVASADIPEASLQNRTGQFEHFLDGLRGGTVKPRLNFLHVGLPHSPWEYLPSGQAYPVTAAIPGLEGDLWTGDRWPTTQAYQRYLLQLGMVDRLIGQLTQRLRDENLYERSVIVVTADHGASFQPGRGRRSARNGGFADIVNVPLFVKTPGQTVGRVDEGPARTIDILPTIASAAGVRLPSGVDGRPLPREGEPGKPVTVNTFGGEAVRVPFEQFTQLRDAEVQRRIGLFGEGNGFEGVFGAGPSGALVGRSVAEVAPGNRAGFRVEFDFRREFFSFSSELSVVPAFVTGRLSGAARGKEEVAIALNGRVAAVTRSYRDGADIRMGAMVPVTAFVEGVNRVEALAISGSGSDLRLAEVGRADREVARLVERDGSLEVESEGQTIAIEAGAAEGFVDSVTLNGEQLSVAGWASDAEHRRPADRVLLFADGELIQGTQPSAQRLDLVETFGPGLEHAGFQFTAIDGGRWIEKPESLRVIAVAGGRGSELASGPDTFPD